MADINVFPPNLTYIIIIYFPIPPAKPATSLTSSLESRFNLILPSKHSELKQQLENERANVKFLDAQNNKKKEFTAMKTQLTKLQAENTSLKQQEKEVSDRLQAATGGANNHASQTTFDHQSFDKLMRQWRARKLKCIDLTDNICGSERRVEFWDQLNILGDADELDSDWEYLRVAGNVPIPMD